MIQDGFNHKLPCNRLINNPIHATLQPGSCLNVVIQYHAMERISRGCELIVKSDDPDHPIRTLEVVAWTLWECCGSCGNKGCCGECCKGERVDAMTRRKKQTKDRCYPDA